MVKVKINYLSTLLNALLILLMVNSLNHIPSPTVRKKTNGNHQEEGQRYVKILWEELNICHSITKICFMLEIFIN